MNKQDIIQKLKDNKDIIEKYGITKLFLFGSYARNEATEDSDIDLVYENDSDKPISYIDYVELEDFLTKIIYKSQLLRYSYLTLNNIPNYITINQKEPYSLAATVMALRFSTGLPGATL